ncbi:hypothetical protein HNR39_000813 [Glaciimonas immobilis]|uniref:Uncharacterized protein n=1 Tax=Glaciimonas immobilis TaxID=728004 RepID=A0A840RML5_9BURK|nr:hypothetical protein [Glaciimonas immobilis]
MKTTGLHHSFDIIIVKRCAINQTVGRERGSY